MSDKVLTDIVINGVPVERVVIWDELTVATAEREPIMPRSTWGPGPWAEEPDKLQWLAPKVGLGCLIVREPMAGHLCGYVRLREDHPLWGLGLDEVWSLPEDDIPDVHGGITYARASQEPIEPEDHAVAEDRGVAWAPHRAADWFLGFDCSHGRDQKPAMDALLLSLGIRTINEQMERRLRDGPWVEVYRDVGYVMEQCHHLAHQLDRLDRKEP